MSTRSTDADEFQPTRKYIDVSNGASIRIIREMQELSRSELAKLSGISKAMLIAIEKDEIKPGASLIKLLAHNLKVPPAVLIEGWRDQDSESAA
jgi:transcriptional regulator with XRE-family HTH domain